MKEMTSRGATETWIEGGEPGRGGNACLVSDSPSAEAEHACGATYFQINAFESAGGDRDPA